MAYECDKCGRIVDTNEFDAGFRAPEERCTCRPAGREAPKAVPKVGDVGYRSLTELVVVTSVTPNLTPYKRADQTTKVESYTVGERALTEEELARFIVADGPKLEAQAAARPLPTLQELRKAANDLVVSLEPDADSGDRVGGTWSNKAELALTVLLDRLS